MATVKFKYDEMMNPVLQALKQLGGSGTNEEIDNKVAELIKIPADQLDILHNPEKGGLKEVEYRLMWTRTYLKKYGLLENSARGVWSLSPRGAVIEKVDTKEVVQFVRELDKKEKRETNENADELSQMVIWQEELLEAILKMSPNSFERLIQRLLRESGFVQVKLPGKQEMGG